MLIHQTTFSSPYRDETITWECSAPASPVCNYRDPGKAGWPIYYVIESLKNCIIYTGPLHGPLHVIFAQSFLSGALLSEIFSVQNFTLLSGSRYVGEGDATSRILQ